GHHADTVQELTVEVHLAPEGEGDGDASGPFVKVGRKIEQRNALLVAHHASAVQALAGFVKVDLAFESAGKVEPLGQAGEVCDEIVHAKRAHDALDEAFWRLIECLHCFLVVAITRYNFQDVLAAGSHRSSKAEHLVLYVVAACMLHLVLRLILLSEK